MSLTRRLNKDVLTVIIHNLDYPSLKELSKCNWRFYELIGPISTIVKQARREYFTDIFKQVILIALNCCAICLEIEGKKVRIEKCGANPLGIYYDADYGKIRIKSENAEVHQNDDEFNHYLEQHVSNVCRISLYMYQYDQKKIIDIIKPLGSNRYTIRHDSCAGNVYSQIVITREIEIKSII